MTTVASPAISSALRELRAAVTADTNYVLALKLTLVLLLLYGATTGAARIPVRVLCGVMLVFPTLLQQAFLWWLLLAALVGANLQVWFTIDNHKYLIMYWALACALSLHFANPAAYLGWTARVLVALVFGFATFWKFLGGEYVDGSFFYWTFLTDARVLRVAAFISGLPPDTIRLGSEAVGMAGTLGLNNLSIPVLASPTLRMATLGLSWLGLLIEGCVALTHALPTRRLYVLRHSALMAFIAMTYFLLPVSGFAFVLTVLGVAQCREDDSAMRWRYIVLLGIVQFVILDWQALLPVD